MYQRRPYFMPPMPTVSEAIYGTLIVLFIWALYQAYTDPTPWPEVPGVEEPVR